jgi:C4-dicarboxylate transporter, DcuC family
VVPSRSDGTTLFSPSMPPLLAGVLEFVVIAAAVVAIARRVEVRLVLILTALVLGTLAGDPTRALRTFLVTLTNEQFVVPICTAMGFAYVLRYTGCDAHLVHLLVQPLRRVRWLLVPGAVVVGFIVDVPIPSQTSTAVTIGAVLIPLLLAARVRPVTIGAALLLGSSVGGELLNPGAPEFRTVVTETNQAVAESTRTIGIHAATAWGVGWQGPLHVLPLLDTRHLGLPLAAEEGLTGPGCVQRTWPLALLQLVLTTGLFWALSARADVRGPVPEPDPAAAQELGFRVNLAKALVPLVPLLLLLLTAPPLGPLRVPVEWLVDNPAGEHDPRFDSRLIGAAMLVGVAAAGLVSARGKPGRPTSGVGRAFFEGAGYAFTHTISLIVAAACFGDAVKAIGAARLVADVIAAVPSLLVPLAGLSAWGFALLSGSGMASTQSLFGFFAAPALRLGIDPGRVGAVVSVAAAAGRTMSPVAAVALICAEMTKTDVFALVRRLLVPLLVATPLTILAGLLLALWR